MARSPFRHVVIAMVAIAALCLPGVARAQSPAPSAGPSPAPTSQVDPGAPPPGWATGICTAYTRIANAPDRLVAVGQAALAGDPDALGAAAIDAGLLGDSALQAMDGLGDTWTPGAALAGYLNATGFALVDVGVALAQTDLGDPEALRTALGNAIAALDGWSRITDEMTRLADRTGFDCAGVPIASPEPPPSAAPVTPQPSFTGDAELLARFPAEIDGSPITPSSRTGAELLATADPADAAAQQQLTDLSDYLEANGFSIEDISLAFAYGPTQDGTGASITAFRVRGSDASTLLEGLIPLVTIDYTDVQQETVTVDGRQLMRVSDGPYKADGIYEILVPVGDTVWAVSAVDPVLTQIVQALAG